MPATIHLAICMAIESLGLRNRSINYFNKNVIHTFILRDLTPHQRSRNIPLSKAITRKKIHSTTNHWVPRSNLYLLKTILHEKVREHCRRNGV